MHEPDFVFQNDIIHVDFGYIVNLAPTVDQEVYNDTYHDEIVIEVELLMADHSFTGNTDLNSVNFSMTFGDVVVNGGYLVVQYTVQWRQRSFI